MRRSRQSDGGFTIVEVMIALIIFSLAAIVLGASYMNVLNSYSAATKTNENDADVDFARNQLLTQADLQTAETGSSFDTSDNRHVTWSAQIDPMDGATDLFQVTFTVEVDDPSAPQPKKVNETFMLVRPTWSDQTTESQSRQNAASRVAQVQGRAPPSS
jgi:general secretion pathway protein I